jgi:hypothetical protein
MIKEQNTSAVANSLPSELTEQAKSDIANILIDSVKAKEAIIYF